MVGRPDNVFTMPRDGEKEEGQGTVVVTAGWRVDRNDCQSGDARVELNADVVRTSRSIAEERMARLGGGEQREVAGQVGKRTWEVGVVRRKDGGKGTYGVWGQVHQVSANER